jgi:hypothetical protein
MFWVSGVFRSRPWLGTEALVWDAGTCHDGPTVGCFLHYGAPLILSIRVLNILLARTARVHGPCQPFFVDSVGLPAYEIPAVNSACNAA